MSSSILTPCPQPLHGRKRAQTIQIVPFLSWVMAGVTSPEELGAVRSASGVQVVPSIVLLYRISFGPPLSPDQTNQTLPSLVWARAGFESLLGREVSLCSADQEFPL